MHLETHLFEPTVDLGPVRPSELPHILGLLTHINDGTTPAALEASLIEMVTRWPDLQRVVRDDLGSVVGVITGAIDDTDAAVGWSHDLVLDPGVRGLGLGSRLLEAQLKGFRRRGCRVVRGQSPERLYRALAFFQRHGFQVIERKVARGLFGISEGREVAITEHLLA